MTARLSRLAGTMPDRLVAKACGVKLGAVWRWRTAHGIPPARWQETPLRRGPGPDPMLVWLEAQHEPVTSRQAAAWAGITIDAAAARLRRCGALRVGQTERKATLWVAP